MQGPKVSEAKHTGGLNVERWYVSRRDGHAPKITSPIWACFTSKRKVHDLFGWCQVIFGACPCALLMFALTPSPLSHWIHFNPILISCWSLITAAAAAAAAATVCHFDLFITAQISPILIPYAHCLDRKRGVKIDRHVLRDPSTGFQCFRSFIMFVSNPNLNLFMGCFLSWETLL